MYTFYYKHVHITYSHQTRMHSWFLVHVCNPATTAATKEP